MSDSVSQSLDQVETMVKDEPVIQNNNQQQNQKQQQQKQQGQSNKNKNKNKKKKKGKDADEEPTFESEGDRLAKAIIDNKAEYYVFDFNLNDNNEQVSLAVNHAITKLVTPCAFLVISAGANKLTATVSVHQDLPEKVPAKIQLDDSNPVFEKLSAKTWLESSLIGLKGELTEDSTDQLATCVLELDTAFKFKDVVRGNAFAYLRKNKLVEEEESDDEMYEF